MLQTINWLKSLFIFISRNSSSCTSCDSVCLNKAVLNRLNSFRKLTIEATHKYNIFNHKIVNSF